MRVTKWFGLLGVLLLLTASFMPAAVFADTKRTIADESIYDLLVDRFNNGIGQNDQNTNTQDPLAFTGGDFTGVALRLQHIVDMGFTIVSLGPVFETDSYDGSQVLDYSKLEPHFGTAEEFSALINEAHEKKLRVIADFPLGQVSANHVWAKDGTLTGNPSSNGTIDWDGTDANVQLLLKNAIVEFVTTYNLDGIRLTKLDKFGSEFLNEVISEVKAAKPGAYVLTNEVNEADFDAKPSTTKINALQQSFVKFDADTSPLAAFEAGNQNDLIQFDDLYGPRFTHEMVEMKMFPPTRWKVAAAALFTLPGTVVVPYGTEIAVNGKSAPDSHPIMNFNTDMELKDLMGDLNSLRNKSEALRTGDFELLHNDAGFTVFKRSSDKETWIVALNNTTKTRNLEIPTEVIGENKVLRGVLDGDRVRESKDGQFRVVVERELAEIYIVEEDKGFNIPYLIASMLVYILFITFLVMVFRKGRQGKKDSKTK